MPRPNSNVYRQLGDGSTEIITAAGDVFVIDSADVEVARRHCWSLHEHGYARAVARINGKLKTVYLHRLLCPTSEAQPHVDHRDGDATNCRRDNLRACNRSENMMNARLRVDSTTGLKGIGPHHPSGKFRARIRINGAVHDLGLFTSSAEAAVAVSVARAKLHGEFARHA